jgi:diguanylate cyclase (GGDEF)-like protein
VCLKADAQEVARAAPRANDLVARYGGEEFVMILGDTDEDGANWVAERIRQHVAGLKLPHKDSSHGIVTVSCGVSSVLPRPDLSVEALVKSADNALFLSKNQGRNTVTYLGYGQI